MFDFSQGMIERAAENRIQEAQELGAFENLPGAGKPIPDIDGPFDENAWVRNWIERERLKQAVDEQKRAGRVCIVADRASR